MTFSIAKREAAMMAKEPATLMDADQEPVMSLSTPESTGFISKEIETTKH